MTFRAITGALSSVVLLASCSLLAPSRSELEGGETDAALDASTDTIQGSTCEEEPGDPGPGRELMGPMGTALVTAAPRGGIALDSRGLFLAAGKSVFRFSKDNFGASGEVRLDQDINAILMGPGSTTMYISTGAATYRVNPAVFATPNLSLQGETGNLTLAFGRVFGVQPALARIVDVDDPTTAIGGVVGKPTVAGNDEAIFWGVPGNARRGFSTGGAIKEKDLLEPGLVSAASTPTVAMGNVSLAVLAEQSPGCATLRVLDARSTTTPVKPKFTIDRLAQLGPVVTSGETLYVSSGTRVIAVDLSSGSRKVIASRLTGCTVGIAADATHVYVACENKKVFQIPR